MLPILHHYDASPFSRKAQKMLGIKGLDWLSIEMPMTAPKPDIEGLTGGYRGTPVLQLGADIFIDNLAIVEALDKVFPDKPALMGHQSRFTDDAIGYWAEQLFDPVLRAAVAKYALSWDADFRADRQGVFPHLDFENSSANMPVYASQIVGMLTTLNRHLEEGNTFIHGAAPSLADVHCWGIMWFVISAIPEVASQIETLSPLMRWYGKVDDIGFGKRSEATFDRAWEAVDLPASGSYVSAEHVDEDFRGWLGCEVRVDAQGADRGAVTGELLAIDQRLLVISVTQENHPSTRIHFPRAGYSLTR